MTTNSSALIVASSAPATNDIRPITPPVQIPSGWMGLVWVLLAAALVTAALLAWQRWRKRSVSIAPRPPLPPHEKARKKLEQALALIHDPKPFCVAVSDTLRVYLEERFEFHAPERTTEEFLFELRDTDRLTAEQKDGLAEFLRQCDLVKFARHEPLQTQLRDLHGIALQLVHDTEPPPPRPEETSRPMLIPHRAA
jgi:hypothetical protein